MKNFEPAPPIKNYKLLWLVIGLIMLGAIIGLVYYFVIPKKEPTNSQPATNSQPVSESAEKLLFAKLSPDDTADYLTTATDEVFSAEISYLKQNQLVPLGTIKGYWPMFEYNGWLYFSDQSSLWNTMSPLKRVSIHLAVHAARTMNIK